jgi:hypothetical protein
MINWWYQHDTLSLPPLTPWHCRTDGNQSSTSTSEHNKHEHNKHEPQHASHRMLTLWL